MSLAANIRPGDLPLVNTHHRYDGEMQFTNINILENNEVNDEATDNILIAKILYVKYPSLNGTKTSIYNRKKQNMPNLSYQRMIVLIDLVSVV